MTGSYRLPVRIIHLSCWEHHLTATASRWDCLKESTAIIDSIERFWSRVLPHLFFFFLCVTVLFYSVCKRSLWEKQTNRKYFRLKTKLGFRIKTKFCFRLKTNTCAIDDLAGIFYLNSFKFSTFNTKIDQRFVCFSFFRPNSSFHWSLFCVSLFLEKKVLICIFPEFNFAHFHCN